MKLQGNKMVNIFWLFENFCPEAKRIVGDLENGCFAKKTAVALSSLPFRVIITSGRSSALCLLICTQGRTLEPQSLCCDVE